MQKYPIYILDKKISPSNVTVRGSVEATYCRLKQERNGMYAISMEIPSQQYREGVYAVHPPENYILQDEKHTNLLDAMHLQLLSNEHNEFVINGIQHFKVPKGKYFSKLKEYDCIYIPIIYHDKLRYQIFRIKELRKIMTASGTMRYAIEAEHIFYDLGFKIVPNIGGTEQGLSGPDFVGYASKVLNSIMHAVENTSPEERRFSYSCDISNTPEMLVVFEQKEQINFARVLLDGGVSFIGRLSGEGRLYRDNFRFSVNQKTEGSRNTGRIAYGENMNSIDFQEDWSECYTNITATDNYGHISEIAISESEFQNFPARIEKRIKFSYPDGLSENEVKRQFGRDFRNYAKKHSKPTVSIKVTFADIADNPLYKDFSNLRSYEVGDLVRIYHSDFGIDYGELEIISKEYDVLENKTISIEIGEFRKDGVHELFYADTIQEV